MNSYNIKSTFEEFTLPQIVEQDLSVIIPTVKGIPLFKYGAHAYYFLNFKTLKGFCVTINHMDIILPGLKRFKKANYKTYKYLSWLRLLLQKYHYNFNFLEQIMIMTVPHTVTGIENGRFFINLWSYFGYLEVDCQNRSVKYCLIEEKEDDHVLGSQQFYDVEKDETYHMSYSLKDSFKRVLSTEQKVYCEILKRENKTDTTTKIWSGGFVDYIHDIVINKTRQYCVVPELGMFVDKSNNLIPSKVLILDLKSGQNWTISSFAVAAHAQFDPNEPDVIYFSNHNFEFVHSNIVKLLKKAIYDINFRGPASVYKYRLTPDGPQELGVFTEPDFFRLTNFQVFNHRGQTILAAMGSPNFIYIVDAESMKFIRKIEVKHPEALKNIPCIIGTFSPSFDGETIFLHTPRTLQKVDVATGKADVILNHSYNHTCSNHMITSNDTDW